MEEFDNKVKKLLFHNKLLTLNDNITLDVLHSGYYELLISKLLKDYKYNIYNNNNSYIVNSLKFITHIPEYYIDSNKIYNLSIDGIKNINKKDTLIIPIAITEKSEINGHIVMFIINFKYKHILYFDSYGVKKNDKSYNLKQILKTFLLNNNITDKSFNMYSINSPWQKYIKDTNNTWLYYGSCLILLGLFTFLYFSVESAYQFETIINFGKIIKKNPQILKDLTIYTFIAITTL